MGNVIIGKNAKYYGMNFDELRLLIEGFFENLNVWVQSINDIIWGWPMLLVLLGTHLFLTFKLRFPQRYTFKAIRLSVKSEKDSEGDVSPYASHGTSTP